MCASAPYWPAAAKTKTMMIKLAHHIQAAHHTFNLHAGWIGYQQSLSSLHYICRTGPMDVMGSNDVFTAGAIANIKHVANAGTSKQIMQTRQRDATRQ